MPAASLTFVCFADLLMPRRGFCFVGCCNELLYDTHSKKFDVCNFFTAIFLFKDPNCYGDFDDFFCKKFREKLKRFCKLQEILRLGSKRVIFLGKVRRKQVQKVKVPAVPPSSASPALQVRA